MNVYMYVRVHECMCVMFVGKVYEFLCFDPQLFPSKLGGEKRDSQL